MEQRYCSVYECSPFFSPVHSKQHSTVASGRSKGMEGPVSLGAPEVTAIVVEMQDNEKRSDDGASKNGITGLERIGSPEKPNKRFSPERCLGKMRSQGSTPVRMESDDAFARETQVAYAYGHCRIFPCGHASTAD